ncbi:MAG: zinc ribbon domain-containing protein [Candidatus Korarchaeota archaeon]
MFNTHFQYEIKGSRFAPGSPPITVPFSITITPSEIVFKSEMTTDRFQRDTTPISYTMRKEIKMLGKRGYFALGIAGASWISLFSTFLFLFNPLRPDSLSEFLFKLLMFLTLIITSLIVGEFSLNYFRAAYESLPPVLVIKLGDIKYKLIGSKEEIEKIINALGYSRVLPSTPPAPSSIPAAYESISFNDVLTRIKGNEKESIHVMVTPTDVVLHGVDYIARLPKNAVSILFHIQLSKKVFSIFGIMIPPIIIIFSLFQSAGDPILLFMSLGISIVIILVLLSVCILISHISNGVDILAGGEHYMIYGNRVKIEALMKALGYSPSTTLPQGISLLQTSPVVPSLPPPTSPPPSAHTSLVSLPTQKETEGIMEKAMVKCPYCGTLNEEDSAACQVCGGKLKT